MPRQKMWPDGKQALEMVSRNNGRQRRVPAVNSGIQDLARKTVHVFNVAPWGYPRNENYRINMGSFGYFFIPACEVGSPMEWERLKARDVQPGVYVPDHWEEGELRVTDPKTEYAAMKPLPGLMMEPMPDTQDECKWNMQDEGRYFANELLGVGIGHAAHDSLVRRGCFVAEGKTPTEAELEQARGELAKFMSGLILEADRAWAAGPQRAEQIIRPEIHHVCAEWMNLKDRAWLRGTDPKAQADCPACGENVKSTAMTCKSCGFVLDKAKYDAAKEAGLFV